MKFTKILQHPNQDIRMILPIFSLILLIFCMIPSSVSAESEYTQGWLSAPDWVLDRIDKSILPDLFIPKNLTGDSEEIPTVTSYVQQGNDLLDSNSFEAAKTQFDGAIGLNSRSFDAWLGKGYALEGLKRYQSALESYEKAIELSNNKIRAWAAYAGKGRALFELQQYQTAGDAYEKSISMFDRSKSGTTEELSVLYRELAEVKAKVGDEAEASYAQRMADELKPGSGINST